MQGENCGLDCGGKQNGSNCFPYKAQEEWEIKDASQCQGPGFSDGKSVSGSRMLPRYRLDCPRLSRLWGTNAWHTRLAIITVHADESVLFHIGMEDRVLFFIFWEGSVNFQLRYHMKAKQNKWKGKWKRVTNYQNKFQNNVNRVLLN